jgi:hypothetical protein
VLLLLFVIVIGVNGDLRGCVVMCVVNTYLVLFLD